MRTIARLACRLAIMLPLAGYAPDAGAQEQVGPGARVRVSTVRVKREVGTVVAMTPDSLVARWPRGDTTALARADITRLDVSRGMRGHPWRGAAIGFVVGAVAGGALAAATYEKPKQETCVPAAFFCGGLELFDRNDTALLGAALGGALGTVGGGLIGAVRRSEAWSPVPIDRVRVAAARSGRGAGLAFAF